MFFQRPYRGREDPKVFGRCRFRETITSLRRDVHYILFSKFGLGRPVADAFRTHPIAAATCAIAGQIKLLLLLFRRVRVR